MEILDITRKDILKCTETFIASYNQPAWNYSWNQPDAINYLNEYIDSPQFKGFMVVENDKVLAALFGHTKTWWTNKQFMIDELFIAPGAQGNDYEKLLLRHLEEYAKKRSIEVLTTLTNKHKPPMEFFKKNDFSTVEYYVFMFKQL